MGQGQDKIAKSLIDLQPTAIVELFLLYFDTVDKGESFIAFHGGSNFNNAIIWQGIQYLPIPVETEGFEITSNNELPRPKIKISNKDYFMTDMLNRYQDLQFAKLIRKRTFIKFLDNENFQGGNPWGEEDFTAEISNDTYLISQKTSENKLFVEFELTSPLDIENFEINNRTILARYCSWFYRGAGCNYDGPPIETEDGRALLLNNTSMYYWGSPDSRAPQEWAINKTYQIGEPAYLINNRNSLDNPTKIWYVCKQLHFSSDQLRPDLASSYWDKDGCSKKINACKKRFVNSDKIIFYNNTAYVTNHYFDSSHYINQNNYKNTIVGLVFDNSTDKIFSSLSGSVGISTWIQFPSGFINNSENFNILHNIQNNCDFSGLNIFASGTNLVAQFSVAHTLKNISESIPTYSDYFSGVQLVVPNWPTNTLTPLHIRIFKGGATGTYTNSVIDSAGYIEISNKLSPDISAKYVLPSRAVVDINGNFLSGDSNKKSFFRFRNPNYQGGISENLFFGIKNYTTPNITSNIKFGPIAIWCTAKNSSATIEGYTNFNRLISVMNDDTVRGKVPIKFSEADNITERDLLAWWDMDLTNNSPYYITNSNPPNEKLLTLTGSYNSSIEQTITTSYKSFIYKHQTPKTYLPFGGFPGTDSYETA